MKRRLRLERMSNLLQTLAHTGCDRTWLDQCRPEAVTSSRVRSASAVFVLVLSVASGLACDSSIVADSAPPGDATRAWEWAEERSDAAFRMIGSNIPACISNCFDAELLVELGAKDDGGFLNSVAEVTYVVQDSARRYWVGQRTSMKVFDASGAFLRDVGRSGQGPLEFQGARPVHSDALGRVHVIDVVNTRETIIGPDFELVEDRRLPSDIGYSAVAVDDGDRYVVQMWHLTPESIGLPLHLIEGPDVLRSFGVSPGTTPEKLNEFKSRRILAADRRGHVYSSKVYDFTVEAWTAEGARIAGFLGPRLNEHTVLPGGFSYENPPPSSILDIHVDDDARLWVIIFEAQPDWPEHVEERIDPTGAVYIDAKDGDWDPVWNNRLDVYDLATGTLLASTSYTDWYLSGFLPDGRVLSIGETPDKNTTLLIWRVTVTS